MAIEYLEGDATVPPLRPAIVAHVVNDLGRWGRGFVVAVSARWPQPEAFYRRWHHDAGLTLGDTQFVAVEDDVVVANMVAQHGTRPARDGTPPIRYDALAYCLDAVAREARAHDALVAMPRIGCGLAGGRWDLVRPIVAEQLTGLRVMVFDLPTGAP